MGSVHAYAHKRAKTLGSTTTTPTCKLARHHQLTRFVPTPCRSNNVDGRGYEYLLPSGTWGQRTSQFHHNTHLQSNNQQSIYLFHLHVAPYGDLQVHSTEWCTCARGQRAHNSAPHLDRSPGKLAHVGHRHHISLPELCKHRNDVHEEEKRCYRQTPIS